MGEYIRKVPHYNDYEQKKDLLEFPHLKKIDPNYERRPKKIPNNDVQYVIKKRENMNDILHHRPDLDTRTQGDLFKERKNELKKQLNENYIDYEKKNPFFIERVVHKTEETKTMKNALNNVYVPFEMDKTRIREDVNTKTMLLDERKKIFLKELGYDATENKAIEFLLDPTQDYKSAVRTKNEVLTFKNYGLGWIPKDHKFSYPHIQAKGKGGWATEIVRANILKDQMDGIEKCNIENIEEFYQKKAFEEKSKVYLMQDRLKYVDFFRNRCSLHNYNEEKPYFGLRSSGFQCFEDMKKKSKIKKKPKSVRL